MTCGDSVCDWTHKGVNDIKRYIKCSNDEFITDDGSHIIPLNEDWEEIKYDFGDFDELSQNHPYVDDAYFEGTDEGDYMLTYVVTDNGDEYALSDFLRETISIDYRGELIHLSGYLTTSNFGGIGIEIADSGDAYRLWNIWS